jgi:redox-sensitive bicupin YhaK (pirin superfamily)
MPAKHKMSQPVYRDITKQDINVYREDNLEVKVISGQYNNVNGPVQSEFVKTTLLDVTLDAGEFIFESEASSNLAVFILEGNGIFDESKEIYPSKNALLFSEGDQLTVQTDETLRFLLLNGEQINEPIAWRGPVVMTTEEALDVAFNEISKNKFIKHKNLK